MTMKNIVLVHGGFVDGAGWEGVYRILKQDGYDVSIVQNPTISLAHDVAATKRILVVQDGPAILVGHSYGGAVITEAGNDPKGSRRLDQAISLTTGSAGLRFRTHFRQKSGYYANNLEREGRLNDISSAILR